MFGYMFFPEVGSELFLRQHTFWHSVIKNPI